MRQYNVDPNNKLNCNVYFLAKTNQSKSGRNKALDC